MKISELLRSSAFPTQTDYNAQKNRDEIFYCKLFCQNRTCLNDELSKLLNYSAPVEGVFRSPYLLTDLLSYDTVADQSNRAKIIQARP